MNQDLYPLMFLLCLYSTWAPIFLMDISKFHGTKFFSYYISQNPQFIYWLHVSVVATSQVSFFLALATSYRNFAIGLCIVASTLFFLYTIVIINLNMRCGEEMADEIKKNWKEWVVKEYMGDKQ